MKKRSLSNSWRVRHASRVTTVALYRSPEEYDDLKSQEDTRELCCKRPAYVFAVAEGAARKVAVRSRRFHNINGEFLEDLTQEVLAAYYEKPEWERPQTENELEVWAYEAAKAAAQDLRSQSSREMWDQIEVHRGGTNSHFVSIIDLVAVNLGWHHCKPPQETRVMAMDALRLVTLLPADLRQTVMDVIRSEDVVGYAKDHNVSLFEAMKTMKFARVVMNRIAEDIADEMKDLSYEAA